MIDQNTMDVHAAVSKHVTSDKFNIFRVKTDTANNVPFHLLNTDFIFKLTYVNIKDEEEVMFFSEDDIDWAVEHYGIWAMILHADWGTDRPNIGMGKKRRLPNFVETIFPDRWDECKENGYIFHTDMLLDGIPFGDNFEGEDDWQIIANYLDAKAPNNSIPF